MNRFRHCILGVIAVLCAACGAREAAAPAATIAAHEPLATSRQVMLGLTIPAADVVWGAGSGAPADDLAWEKVTANAVMIAESGAMLLAAPRNPGQPEWTEQAEAMIAAAKAAAEAAQQHNLDGVLEAGDALYASCESCHEKFMPAKVAEIAAEQAAGAAAP